jgi:2-dehydropantoate 2-reductase
MKIAVIGAGAIGSLVAGYLKMKDVAVTLVAREASVAAIRKKGLEISGVRGDAVVPVEVVEKLTAAPDLVVFTCKTQDLDEAVKQNLDFLRGPFLVTTQNGVRAEEIVARYLPRERVIASIVMFGATSLEPGKVVHNFEGSWVIGNAFGGNNQETIAVSGVLDKAFPTLLADDMKGMKYLKVFVNANNCIPAILGVSMQEAFKNKEISKIAIAIWKEGLGVVKKAGVKLASLPDFPLERLEKLTALPLEEAAQILSGIMTNLSKEPLYGSVLQSIKRGKKSEIDFLNGEFVALAKEHGGRAPLNEKLVAMVHAVEKEKKFFAPDELIAAVIPGLIG